jgi:hypothetical protein
MIDITPVLESFIVRRPGWRPEFSVQAAAAIARELVTHVAWDEGAGEDWARVLAGDQGGVMIFMAGPLVVASHDVAQRVRMAAGDLPAVTVPTLDAAVLSCQAEALRAAFGDRVWDHPALNVERFSADELWFCTV